jgi:hypothetical protein
MAESTLFLQFFPTCVVGLIAEPMKGDDLRFRKAFRLSPEHGDSGTPETGLASRLRQEIQHARHSAIPRQCVLVLPRQDVASLSLQLPAGTDAETAAMLELDLKDRLPLDADDISHGWEKVGAAPDGRETVLVYWTPRRKLAPMLDVIRAAHLEIVGVFPVPAIHRRVFRGDPGGDLLLMAYFSEEGFELTCWGESGALLFSRGKLVEFESEGDGQRDNGVLRSEFAASVRACAEQLGGSKAVRCVWFGPADVADALRAEGIVPQEEDASRKRIADLLGRIEQGDGLSFLSLTAAAQMGESLLPATPGRVSSSSLNMMPKSLRLSKEGAFRRRQTLKAGFLALSILILAAGNLWLYSFDMERQLASNREQISRLAPLAKDVDAMEERIRTIREQIDYIVSPADALKEINSLLADNAADLEGLFLDHMTYKASGQIIMEGHVTNDITPWRFAEFLDASGLYRVAEKPRVETFSLGQARRIRFSLSVNVCKRAVSPSGAKEAGE